MAGVDIGAMMVHYLRFGRVVRHCQPKKKENKMKKPGTGWRNYKVKVLYHSYLNIKIFEATYIY